MRLLGLDPGLGATGWGVIEVEGGHLRHVGDGVVRTSAKEPLALRLVRLAEGLEMVIARYHVAEAAVEETFVNRNATSTLRLGQARGTALLVSARAGLSVSEYLPNLVKKSVVGSGHACKEQVKMMVGVLLPGAELASEDAADALAVAICHAHHRETARRLAAAAR
ncbi:MAG: crossover junction endodeoxyribonuclease RuvC [Rhodospirillales bacterium]|jgi:crossover junction endodeoxyribonuclease RuvC|nr:crossover junction endodeoxyribonuclease RuvC [Rhodospirillales bacterium]